MRPFADITTLADDVRSWRARCKLGGCWPKGHDLFGTSYFSGSRVHHFTGVTLEDLDSCVEADSRQLPHVKHIIAACAAADRMGYCVSHDYALYQARIDVNRDGIRAPNND